MDVHHFRQPGKRECLGAAHILATPYTMGSDDDAERFTHVYILCAVTPPVNQSVQWTRGQAVIDVGATPPMPKTTWSPSTKSSPRRGGEG
ncbi:hypothetical protein L915_07085 [Phytophthora nicotianae]|uniref:Uncharacterized protein n=1 Tax=Phytophthora nicotianae TaxID=4792 RepID=W2H0C8_PHYNI|nr:hypothetical protein L915_07085 [Phytophthora nicotianae]